MHTVFPQAWCHKRLVIRVRKRAEGEKKKNRSTGVPSTAVHMRVIAVHMHVIPELGR